MEEEVRDILRNAVKDAGMPSPRLGSRLRERFSAVMRRDADPVVVAWLDRQPSESLWLTTITVFEVRFGLGLVPDGRRRRESERAFSGALEEDFQRRVLPFDFGAAEESAALAARRRHAGQSVDSRNTQIAGIVTARRAMLATRNTRHFRDLSVSVVDPWAE